MIKTKTTVELKPNDIIQHELGTQLTIVEVSLTAEKDRTDLVFINANGKYRHMTFPNDYKWKVVGFRSP